MEISAQKDRITYLGRNDIVYTSIEDMIKKTGMQPVPSMVIKDSEGGLKSELAKHSRLLSQIANKRELQLGTSDRGLTAIWKHGANTVKYINENTNWSV